MDADLPAKSDPIMKVLVNDITNARDVMMTLSTMPILCNNVDVIIFTQALCVTMHLFNNVYINAI